MMKNFLMQISIGTEMTPIKKIIKALLLIDFNDLDLWMNTQHCNSTKRDINMGTRTYKAKFDWIKPNAFSIIMHTAAITASSVT